MSDYDAQQICMNGHQITASVHDFPQYARKFCEKCGEATTIKCPKCSKEIPGFARGSMSPRLPTVPSHCGECGEPFPWKGKIQSAPAQSPIQTVTKLLRRFHRVVRRLRNRHEQRDTLDVQDEYDVQDLLHALLQTDFDDVRAEEWTPSYAGGSSRMDFLLKSEQIVVECKRSRAKQKDKDIGEELLVDIARYSAHPDCKTLVCFVYDPDGRIGNATGLERDLESKSASGLKVVAIIVQG